MRPAFAPLWENEAAPLIRRAAELVKTIEFWWCKQYNRPLKDPLLQEYTQEELYEEFFAWCIDRNPEIALMADEDTHVQFQTGDEKIDELEERLARGEDVNFLDALVDPEDAAKIRNHGKEKQTGFEELRKEIEKYGGGDLLDGAEETYGEEDETEKKPLRLY